LDHPQTQNKKKMKYLNTLLPAEALLLSEGWPCYVRRYLKAGFLHLLLNQVLKVEAQGPDANGKDMADKWVRPGKNLLSYNMAPCEKPLLALFDQTGSPLAPAGFWFSQVAKVAQHQTGSKARYVASIYKHSQHPEWYKRGFWSQLLKGFQLTEEGRRVQAALQQEIAETETKMTGYMANEPEKAQGILKQIKGNVLLLASVDIAALTAIDKDLLAAMNQPAPAEEQAHGSGCGGSGCSTVYSALGAWDSNYDDYSGSWDSSCSSDSSSSSGDGGGDSGCGGSGCSGCGGD
jgi:hypothetical protein